MKIFEMVGEIAIDNDKAVAQIKDVEGQAKKSSGKMQKAFRKAGNALKTGLKIGATAAAGALATMTASSIREFAQFDEKMREVYTLMPNASEDMKEELSDDVRDLGEEFGFLTDDTVPALYQAISAGVPPENVMDFMETAAKSAKAGVTDLQTSVDGLSSAVNAYGEEVLDAEHASDIMFTAVKEGKTTYAELAQNMSNVTPIAASLGVEFEGINAALATMTAQGMDTGKATIYMRAMLNQLSKSGSDANDVFKEMADQTFTEFIDSGNSLADALELMEEYAAKNNTSIKKLFANVRAGTGALQLTGANMDTFNKNMGEMESSAGSAETAYQEMSESLQQTLDELRSWWQNQRIEIGEDLEGQFRDLLEWLQNNEDEISSAIESTFDVLINGLEWLKNNKGQIKDGFSNVVSGIQGTADALGNIPIGTLKALWGFLMGPFSQAELKKPEGLITLNDILGRTGDESEETKKQMSDLDKASLNLKNTLSDLKAEYDLSESQISTVESELKGFANTMVGTNLVFDNHKEKQLALRNVVDKLGIKINRQQPIWKRLNNLQQDNTNKTEENTEKTEENAKAQNELTQRIKEQNLAQENVNANLDEGSESFSEITSQMRSLYNLGEIDSNRYMSFLQNQIGQVDKYSEKWIQLKGQIQSVNEDIKQEQKETVQSLFDELPKFEGVLEPYKVEWEGFNEDLKNNISDTLTSMITDFQNFGDHLRSFFDSLTRNIINRYTDKWAAVIVDSLPTPGGGGSGGGGGGINWGNLVQWGAQLLGNMDTGGKTTGPVTTTLSKDRKEEYVVPMDESLLSELGNKIVGAMNTGEGGGAGGVQGDVNIVQVEGMNDRAFVNGVQRNKDSVVAQIMDAVGNNEQIRQQLKRAL